MGHTEWHDSYGTGQVKDRIKTLEPITLIRETGDRVGGYHGFSIYLSDGAYKKVSMMAKATGAFSVDACLRKAIERMLRE